MGTTLLEKPRTRNAALDIARVVAIAAVVMIHSSADFVTDCELGTSQFVWGNIFNSISRLGVPLFVMTSGALLLNEEKKFTIEGLFKKRLPQIIMLLIGWSVIYAVGYEIAIPLLNGDAVSITSFISAFALGHYHLWYLYMLIGLYLALPFLRNFVLKKNQTLVLLYIGISVLCQFIIPVIRAVASYIDIASHLITLIDKFELGFFNVFVSYFLAGWYIVNVGIPKKFGIALCTVSSISLITMIVYVNFTQQYEHAYVNHGLLDFLYSIGVFYALNAFYKKPNCGKIASIVSKYSFGIYVVHVVFLDVVKKVLPETLFAPVYILVCWVVSFSVSLLATFVLSKIPFFKKLVRM